MSSVRARAGNGDGTRSKIANTRTKNRRSQSYKTYHNTLHVDSLCRDRTNLHS